MKKTSVGFTVGVVLLSLGILLSVISLAVLGFTFKYYQDNGTETQGVVVIETEKDDEGYFVDNEYIEYYAGDTKILVDAGDNYELGEEVTLIYLDDEPRNYLMVSGFSISGICCSIPGVFCLLALIVLIVIKKSRNKTDSGDNDSWDNNSKKPPKITGKEPSEYYEYTTHIKCVITKIVFVDRKDYIENVTPITFYCKSIDGIEYKCEVLYSKVRGIYAGQIVNVYIDKYDPSSYYVDYQTIRGR